MTVLFRLLLCCALVVLTAEGGAESWPSRPIKLAVPTGPGAATDVMARLLAESVSRTLGQSIIVENMPGASGILAHQSVARAAPDGYTLLFTNTSGMAINLISFKQLPYDPMRDFTPVALVSNLGPQMLSVNATLPVSTVSELIAYAKSNRGKLSIAFDNTAGAAAFAAKLFNKRADLGLIEVPYRSAAQMAQDVASGVNQVMISSIAAANAVVQAGKVRRLAVTSGKRFPGLPDLPSLQETVSGTVIDGFFCHCGALRHASRGGRAAQSRDRAVPQGPRDPGTVAVFRARDRGRGHTRKYRTIYPGGAGPVARVRKGAGRSATVSRERLHQGDRPGWSVLPRGGNNGDRE
jgi:tripartite-type tricarboxylate transporter receptor subunit TctC